MRGLGGVYKRGPVYGIRYHHRGREYRESARSTERSDAVRLLRQRLADLTHGRPSGPAEDVLDFGYVAGWRRGEVLSLESQRARLYACASVCQAGGAGAATGCAAPETTPRALRRQ